MFDTASQYAFAALTTAGQDVSLFKRYGAVREDAQERTKWHLLLPLDQKESLEVPTFSKTEDGNHALSWEAEERVYTLDRLKAIEEATDSLFRAQEAKGAKAKGLPVSFMHNIERRLQGEELPDESLERAGTIVGVHVCDTSAVHPAGLYACVEWTSKAWHQIQDGTWHDLSIALATDYRLADGSSVEGEVMFAAALVDVGFFEAIPSARDGLPVEAFSTPSEETIATYRRGISRRLHSRNTMNVKLRMDEGMLDQIKAVVAEAMADHVAALHALTEKCYAMDERLCKLAEAEMDEDAAEVVEEDEDEEGEVELAAATATTTMAAAPTDTAEAIAIRVANKVAPYGEAKIAEVVQGHVESGRLLPAHVRAYALALAKGQADVASSMLGDFTGMSLRSGFSSAPVATPNAVARPEKVTAATIVSSMEQEGKFRKGTKDFVAEMYSRISKAREAGLLTD